MAETKQETPSLPTPTSAKQLVITETAPTRPSRRKRDRHTPEGRAREKVSRSLKYLGDEGPKTVVKFDDDAKTKFIQHFAGCGLVIQSALAAGVSDETVRHAREVDPAFAAAYEYALRKFREKLEMEAVRRGHNGWMEPVVQKGRVAHYDCETCKGFGRIAPEGKSIMADYFSVEARMALPVCRPCNGTGQGDAVYTFKADSQVFQKILARHIPEYRDHVNIDAKVTGGVLVVNAQPETNEQWESRWAGKRAPSIDAEFSSVASPEAAPPRADDDISDADVSEASIVDGAASVPGEQGPITGQPIVRAKNRAGSGRVRVER